MYVSIYIYVCAGDKVFRRCTVPVYRTKMQYCRRADAAMEYWPHYQVRARCILTYLMHRIYIRARVYIYADCAPHRAVSHINTYKYIYTYIHTHIRTYVHTYVRTYIYRRVRGTMHSTESLTRV